MVRVQSAGQRKVWFEDIELECLVEHSLIAEWTIAKMEPNKRLDMERIEGSLANAVRDET